MNCVAAGKSAPATQRIKSGIIWFILLAVALYASVSTAETRGGIAPFDPVLYETGYRIFLMNGNTGDALILAEAAVAARPGDRTWRERAARCAEWSGKPEKALEEWTWLALNTDDGVAGDRAMKLARSMNDIRTEHKLLKRLLDKGPDPATLRAFVLTGEQLGELTGIINFLETLKGGPFRGYAVEQLARLYEENGSPGEAVRALRECAENNRLPVRSLLHLANLQYGMGDIRGTYETLKGAAKTGAADDGGYLAALSDVCWTAQDIECSAKASRALVVRGKEREQDYQRLIFSLREVNRPEAFTLSRAAWKRFGKPWFFTDIVELGESLGKWKELDGIIAGLESGERARLARSADFHLLRSRVSMRLGKPGEALSAYREALRLRPGDEGTAAGYIWLLLDLKQTGELKRVVRQWTEKGAGSAAIADALGPAAAYLGENGKALVLYRERYREKKDDPLWIAAYADVLEQNNRPGEAFSERTRGLGILRKEMKKRGLSPDALKEMQVNLAGLMLGVEKGDRPDSLMELIASGAMDDGRRELVAAWALSCERNDFARWWLWKEYARDAMKPAWVRLGLAMEENDRTKIFDLLQGDPDRLPYRDAVEGARTVGALPLAEQIAWDSSNRNPDDYQLYNQLKDIFQGHPSFARYGLRLLDRGGVGGVENGVSVSVPLTRRFTLFSDFRHTVNTALRGGVIADLPAADLQGTAGMSARFEKGLATVSLGWRSAVEDFPMFGAALSYRLTSNVEAGAEFEYSRPADESAPLIVGGARDRAALDITWTPTARDTVQGRFARTWLRDQSRRPLGEGLEYTLDVSRKLHFGYPDISVRAFGGYHGFETVGAPRGNTLSLIPEGAPADASFFIPGSYWQTGLGASAGQGYLDGYTKSWKPFAAADVSWKSDTGAGFSLEAGAHGPLFGCDSLYFSLQLNSGSFATSDLSAVAGMGYRYFFN